MYKRSILILLSVMLIPVSPLRASLTPDEQKLLSQIDAGAMMHTIEHMCDDRFMGRKAGSPEHYALVDYLESRFAEDGLKHVEGLQGFRQPLTMRYALINSKDDIKATISYKAGGRELVRIFAYRGYNGNGGLDLSSDVVFVGYGISDPASGYDDYAGLDTFGKIVLWLHGQPSGIKLSKPVTASQKMLTAFQHGAEACLIYGSDDKKDTPGTNIGLAGAIADFPCITVDSGIAAELLPSVKIGNGKLPVGTRGVKVRLQVNSICDPKRQTFNVIGQIPGSDPQVADEIVMVGAHYDHIGADGQGKLFRGADDNASGTSVVLEIARAMKHAGLKPRRTIVFASWTGEEGGLIGSNHFVANTPFPLKSIISNFQLDMVGVGNPGTFMTTGASAFPDHYQYLKSSGIDLGYTLKADIVRGASDHLAFVRKKVPCSLIHADGEHPNLHSVRDTPATINRKVLESTAKLTALAVWRAATM